MNRLYILLTVMVVMVGALFAGHQALAKVLSGTAGDDTLVGTDTNDRFTGLRGADSLTGRDGEDRLKGSRGNDRLKGSRGPTSGVAEPPSGVVEATTRSSPAKVTTQIYAGAGADRIYARDTRGGGLHRLRGWLRQGRDHTPPRRDSA